MTFLKTKVGFTLLELMISMVILATALSGILPFFFYSQAQMKQATITTMAMGLVQEKMEHVAQLDFDLIHFMDAPFLPDISTQYTYMLPEYFLNPCNSVAPNPCGYQSSTNMLVDIISRKGYYFTRTIDVDSLTQIGSLELPEDSGPAPTFTYLPNADTVGITIEVRWRRPGGERVVRSSTWVYDSNNFQDIL